MNDDSLCAASAPNHGARTAAPGLAERLGLDLAHRLGSLGLFLLLGGIAAVSAGKTAALLRLGHYLLLGAFAACDLAILGGLGAWWIRHQRAQRSGEARGAILFNSILLLTAVVLLIYRRHA